MSLQMESYMEINWLKGYNWPCNTALQRHTALITKNESSAPCPVHLLSHHSCNAPSDTIKLE